MERPTSVEAHLTEIERLLDQPDSQRLHVGADVLFTLVGDLDVAGPLRAMAAGVEGERPHRQGHRLKRYPHRHGAVAAEGPVVLVAMRGRDASVGFLV